jgi:hypothetical protein
LDDLVLENTRSVVSDALGAIGFLILADRLPVDSTGVNLGKFREALPLLGGMSRAHPDALFAVDAGFRDGLI